MDGQIRDEIIKLEDLRKTFKTKHGATRALDGVTLSVKRGEILGVIGFSGAGKSTLIRCINALERPDSGAVCINGQRMIAENGKLFYTVSGAKGEIKKRVSEKQLNAVRKRTGMIFQHFNLFDRSTVRDNVAYSLQFTGKTREEIENRVTELLQLVGLSEKAEAYPCELSGGQKQRVAIARALANDPDVLLSDEATSALDPNATENVLQLLKEVNGKLGITVVLITHEMSVIKAICDRVAVMENGAIAEQGAVYDIFTHPEKDITKNFVYSSTPLGKIETLVKNNSPLVQTQKGGALVKLSFGNNCNQSAISDTAKRFDVNISIVLANVETLGDDTAGGLIAVIDGNKEEVKKAIEFLREKNIDAEVIENVAAV